MTSAFASMAVTLQALNRTPEERRLDSWKRYYARNQEAKRVYRRLMYRVKALDLIGPLFGETYANR